MLFPKSLNKEKILKGHFKIVGLHDLFVADFYMKN
jgi:hypothetical protein